MHLLDDGTLALSASDLTGYSACEHLTELELSVLRGERERPKRDDPMLDVLSRRGGEHEEQQFARYRAEGLKVIDVEYPDNTVAALADAEAQTLAAMQSSTDVIYQATFFHEGVGGWWRGHADFLLKVDTPSPNLGAWSYEVADAKLARRVKAAALLQMCAYSEQVERLQGVAPTQMHVITGDGETHAFKLTDYSAYYRALKARFGELVSGPTTTTYPDPVDHCGICRWAEVCKDRRRADDHLSLVSGMRRDQTRKLTDVGIATRRDLAHADPELTVAGIGEASYERLRHQAELQVKGEGHEPPIFELLPPEPPATDTADPSAPTGTRPKRGWALLPEPSPGDLYFDMEGDPFAIDDEADTGLEYLFGVSWINANRQSEYRAFWAHTRAEEKTAFEAFVDFVQERRAEHPDLHVYHYAPYETTAVKRLMGSHHTRESDVDEWLRAEVFVDLYAVVRAAVRIGAESYSLKQVEHLYLERDAGEVMNAADSIVEYEAYLDDHSPARLDAIERYNEDDCRSTLELHRWLEQQRAEVVTKYGEFPYAELREGEAPEQVAERAARVAELTEALLGDAPADELPARQRLADMLDWHRREAKPDWWMYYARLKLSDDELFDDRECISGLRYLGDVGPDKQSMVQRYGFEPQDHKFKVGSDAYDPRAEYLRAGEVVRIDDVAGEVELKRGPSLVGSHPPALIPGPPRGTGVLEQGIERLVEHVIEHGLHAPGQYRAALDMLLRKQRDPDAGPFDESFLAIQGPPGSGKTTTGAELIAELVQAGARVGITAHSHAVIGNLIEAVGERGTEVSVLQKAEDHQRCSHGIVTCTTDNAVVEAAVRDREYDVIAGTSWLWARPGMADAVDVLFVDEAGQKSLVDALAVSGATTQLVLLGDPQQLAQPSKGSHPEGAEVSALEHVLGEHATMPPDRGWFLESTYRMHPSICEFISEVAYDGRLHPALGAGLERQEVDGFAGLRYVPVVHAGNRSWSIGEVQVVDEMVRGLLGKTWVDRFGMKHEVMLDDVLVVTPYNAQVAKLTAALPEGARIGTVDKFQGQEAPVVIYSMATSSADDVPRSMEFLYDLHRLNVAVSRAKAMSAVVASPELTSVQCRTPEQLALASALCLLAKAGIAS